jgi:hypothetical protein
LTPDAPPYSRQSARQRLTDVDIERCAVLSGKSAALTRRERQGRTGEGTSVLDINRRDALNAGIFSLFLNMSLLSFAVSGDFIVKNKIINTIALCSHKSIQNAFV